MLPWLATKRTKFFAESEIGLWHGVSLCNSSGIAGLSLLCYWLLFSLLRAHSAQLSSVHSTLKIVPTRPWLTGPWNGRSSLSFSQSYIFQELKLWQNNWLFFSSSKGSLSSAQLSLAQLSSVHSTLKQVPTQPWLTGPWNGRSLLSFSQSYVFQVLKLWQNNWLLFLF